MNLTTLAEDTRFALVDLADRATGWVSPSLRLGVTGLSRAGKTVFISALAHNLIHGGRLPLFRAYSSGRILGAEIKPQPDDAVPRFEYERHVAALVDERIWPESTRRISELRLTISYESASFWARRFGRGELNLDLVDYPGEWLLDLPLLGKDFPTWAEETLARAGIRGGAGSKWLAGLDAVNPDAPADESLARELAAKFTDYLRACRSEEATLPPGPGRFLMPGDLEGSPALTFAPLRRPQDGTLPPPTSLFAMMARRYESYKAAVVRPFFRDHFARLDRQIVLVDALAAINGGPVALAELENALTEILGAFRIGSGNLFSNLVSRRIGKILVAATKADHLHRNDHDRLEAVMSRLLKRAIDRASFSGAEVDVLALAAVRSTREGTLAEAGEDLPAIVGVPLPDETIDGQTFDGNTEIAVFPGDLPRDPEALFGSDGGQQVEPGSLRFVRFRPPPLERTAEGYRLSLPHVRLDRALEFLLGDRLA